VPVIRRLIVVGGLLGALMAATPATAAPTPVYGTLQPLSCVADTASTPTGCGKVTGLRNDAFAAISPDGRSVYVGSRDDYVLTVFRRDARTGALKAASCLQEPDAGFKQCPKVPGLKRPTGIVVSPDGRNVYVNAENGNAVFAFRRNRKTGALTLLGCLGGDRAAPTCGSVPSIDGPIGITIAPDGGQVYVTGRYSMSLVVLRRDATTGALSFASCAGPTAPCAPVVGMREPRWVAIAPDGRHVYVAASASNSLAAFSRDPATGAVTPIGCWSGLSDGQYREPGCSLARGVYFPEFVAVSPDGASVYTAGGGAIESSDLTVFARAAPTGALTQASGFDGCIADYVSVFEDCNASLGLGAALGIAFDPTGTNVYVAAYDPGTIGAYRRDATTGSLTRLAPCFSTAGAPCEQQAGMKRAGFTFVSPDGRHVYVMAPESGAIEVFGRRAAPPVLTLGRAPLKLRGGRGTLRLPCPKDAPLGCFGSMRTQVLGQSGRPVGAGVTVRFDLRPGRSARLKVRLDAASRRALRATRKDVVQVTVTSRAPGRERITLPFWLTVRGG
jgi:6-phosphogluconolactonase (cycloisomerase 2 family)